jgi:sugar phosphate isomerase/epimerase
MITELSCSSLAFTSLPMAEALDRMQRLGFTRWEIPVRCDGVWPGHLDADMLLRNRGATAELTAVIRSSGLQLDSAGYEGRHDTPLADELPRVRALASWLADLGAQRLTVFLYNHGAAPLTMRYAALLAIATNHGLDLCVETHLGTALANPERALALIRDLGLRLCLDASHYVVQGLAPATWAALLPAVAAVQIRRCSPLAMQLDGPPDPHEVPLPFLLPANLSSIPVIEYIDQHDGPDSAHWDAAIRGLRQSLLQW